jgi:hypothetical protein
MVLHTVQVGRSLAMRLSCTWTIRLETGGKMEGYRRVAKRSGGDIDRIDAWKGVI